MKTLHTTLATILIICAAAAAQQPRFDHAGFGFQMGLVIPGNPDPVDVGLNLGGHGVVAFDLGKFGEAHYIPGIDVWFGGDEINDWDYFALEINLNIADVRYYFPLPFVVRPYVGLGPMINLEYYRQEHRYWVGNLQVTDEWDDWDPDPGFNFFSGVDFRITDRFSAYVEMRGKVGDWDIFKLLGGMSFALGR